MTLGSLIWILIFIASAALFFALAVIIGVLGLRDLKELLASSKKDPTGRKE